LRMRRGRGGGGRREVRWLECGRQGRANEFPLPVGPTPRGDIHTVHSMGRSRRRAGYGCPPGIATHGPRPPGGAGEERRRRGRGGGAGRSVWMACRREVRWLECGRQGRGNEFPLPVGPTPRGDIHTVHSMGRPWRRAGHDCPPGIATHGPRPRWGRGRSAAGAGGVGEADRRARVSLRRRGRGGGCRQKRMGILLRRRGWGGGGRQKCMGSLPPKAWVEWGRYVGSRER